MSALLAALLAAAVVMLCVIAGHLARIVRLLEAANERTDETHRLIGWIGNVGARWHG